MSTLFPDTHPEAGRMPGQRCALTEKGTAYWDYIPRLFSWPADQDHSHCPIWKPYQLVRNLLAAAVDPERRQIRGKPTAVLIYDANNPAFALGGKAGSQFQTVGTALQGPAVLKRTTWQAIARVLSEKGGYEDLLEWLEEKYEIMPA